MSKSISLLVPEKNDSFSRIKKFMSNEESGIVLTAKEEDMLRRWNYAQSLLAERKFTHEQIAEKISKLHSISIYTAREDVNKARSLYVNITDDYKRYTLFHHVEDIDSIIRMCKVDKSLFSLLPKLFAEKTRAIVGMPVTVQNPDVPAPIILVETTTGLKQAMSAEEAMRLADELIEFEIKHAEEANYEIIPDEPENT